MTFFNKIATLLNRSKSQKVVEISSVELQEKARLLIRQGNDLEDAGLISEALLQYERAVRIAPKFAEGHLNIGNAFLAIGKTNEAIKSYQNAIAQQPNLAAAYFNLGNAQTELKQNSAALTSYNHAIRLKPDFVNAWIALGNTLGDLLRPDSAIISYKKALELEPNHAQIHRNLGLTLRNLGQLIDAKNSFSLAVSLDPTSIESYCDLANVLRELGQVSEAVSIARKACKLDPQSSSAHSLLLFCLSHSGDISPQDLFLEHQQFGQKFDSDQTDSLHIHTNDKNLNRVLKIGLVSADLRNHAVASFFEPVFYFLLKMNNAVLYIYDNGGPEDEVSRRMKLHHATHWIEVGMHTTQALADLIRHDCIDVLIDLSGHTPGHRLLTFAQKPAPIQVSWIGYPGTTGMRSMDYYLADSHFLPPGEFDSYFTEKIMRLPANAPFQSIKDSPDVNSLPALVNGYITFGSFNRLDKISKEVVALWSKLLCAVPSAKMVVGGMPLKGDLEDITDWFLQGGVHSDRLIFYRRSSMLEYLKLHHLVDVCLDTFPYGGATTTCHALWMGVPTLTLVGNTPAAVSSRSVLSHVGIKAHFVATNTEEFLLKSLWCTTHLGEMAALRNELRARFQQSNMMHPEVVAGGLEEAVRFAWQRWCKNLPPASFEITHQQDKFAVILQEN